MNAQSDVNFNDVNSWQDGVFMEMLQKKLLKIVEDETMQDWAKVRAIMAEFGKYTTTTLIVPKPGAF